VGGDLGDFLVSRSDPAREKGEILSQDSRKGTRGQLKSSGVEIMIESSLKSSLLFPWRPGGVRGIADPEKKERRAEKPGSTARRKTDATPTGYIV